MRYIIGIDLGTTNSCVAYVDTLSPKPAIQPFKIPQLTDTGYLEAQTTLPSYCYLATVEENVKGALNLPWRNHCDYVVGYFARNQGARVPTRLVASAKSWLCHPAVNRRDKILPFEAYDEKKRISPVEASARYLSHIKDAWNHVIAQGDLEAEFGEQEIILTVPASFDEIARSLTAEAAKLAGIRHMTLLEEPQAAFYSWISQHEEDWQKKLPAGSCILVCDVGGGTTDFSLIEVLEKEGGNLAFQRMSVGDHLLLGGDNMDAAIAHQLEAKLQQQGRVDLSSVQWMQLCHQARQAKEILLDAKNDQEQYRMTIQGTGSSVVKGSLSTEISREDIKELILQGFLGKYEWQDAIRLRKASGMRTMGLPYEDEPAITKHLAHFLAISSFTKNEPKKPDFVLFNGGAMKPLQFQEAILDSLRLWFPEKDPIVLSSYSLDLAVARGAAYYGKVRRGMGVRIGGGAARGYYLGVDLKDNQGVAQHKALTLLPRGSEEGAAYEPDQIFWLTPNIPVSFQLYSSHVRLHDTQGTLCPIDPEEMQSLPPIHTVLRFGKKQTSEGQPEKIPVHLGIKLTAIGTLELWLKSQKTEHIWTLEFQLRTEAGQDNTLTMLEKGRSDETFDKGYLVKAEESIQNLFSGNGKELPERIMETLEEALGRPRREWPPSVLRGLWEPLLKQAAKRKVSPVYEARWWNLAGFFLRPGFGYPLDDFRLKELWKIILSDYKASKAIESQIQAWICYRRIAGGLNKGQQSQIASELFLSLGTKKSGKIDFKNKAELYQFSEKIRTLAAFELIEVPLKIKIGEIVLTRLCSGIGIAADYWALGRIGARHLFHGSAANVVPSDACARWLEDLLKTKTIDDEQLVFVVSQLARKTDHRELNLPPVLIDKIHHRFENNVHFGRLQELLYQESHLTRSEQEQIFGERLPAGLAIEM